MEKIMEIILIASVLMLAVLGLADLVSYIVRSLFSLPVDMPTGETLTVNLRNADIAEQQLRSLLSKINSGTYRGRVEVLAQDEESFIIAGKILRKYPNIGLFYRKDLNYNI